MADAQVHKKNGEIGLILFRISMWFGFQKTFAIKIRLTHNEYSPMLEFALTLYLSTKNDEPVRRADYWKWLLFFLLISVWVRFHLSFFTWIVYSTKSIFVVHANKNFSQFYFTYMYVFHRMSFDLSTGGSIFVPFVRQKCCRKFNSFTVC